jgi:ADP-heptose:LPS heptosyltransferase
LDLRDDLDGAAALTSCLDLVVSAATSVSCMAGALGVPTLEFRPTPVADKFLVDGACPWFASLQYVDKKATEPWSAVFHKVARHVEAMKG